MKRLITICIVLTAVAMIASSAFAEVQNVKVSGDIDTKAIYRENYTLLPASLRGATVDGHDNSLITAARLRVDADLTDNVMATVRLLDEWQWDTQTSTNDATANDIVMDLANVTLKEAFYAPLTVIVGRQPLLYGKGFIIGDPDTNTTSGDGNVGTLTDLSLQKSFDAIRTIWDYSPWTIDAFFMKINETGATTNKRDADLYGINAGTTFEKYNSEAEAYVLLLKNDQAASPDPDGTATAINTMYPGNEVSTFGVRGSMTPIENLNVLGEIAWQRGDYDNMAITKRDQEAMAYQIGADYTLANWDWKPVLKAGWTHYDGEPSDNSGDHTGWIPLFEDQTHGMIANYIFGGVNGGQNSNADILSLGASVDPTEDLNLSLDFYYFWLDEKLVTTDNAAIAHTGLGWINLAEGAGGTAYYAKAEDDLGYEVDLTLAYDYTEDVKMGLCAGWFIPGDVLDGDNAGATNDENPIQVLATLDVAF
ncbi:MAG: alginate export family protein [Candidatus Omnitrophota bacterium]